MVSVPVVRIDEVVDATGAGDAFLGGLIAGMYVIFTLGNTSELKAISVCS